MASPCCSILPSRFCSAHGGLRSATEPDATVLIRLLIPQLYGAGLRTGYANQAETITLGISRLFAKSNNVANRKTATPPSKANDHFGA
jgi:hypothetical protein